MYGLPPWLTQALAILLPLVLWCAFWLWAVNWKNTWPELARGAWLPVVLLVLVVALVWSRLQPEPWNVSGAFAVPGFWWQLACVGLLVGIALFCGWLQTLLGWTPAEVNFEPPAHDDHGHDHGHAHH